MRFFKRGFTYIELLVSMGILVIIALAVATDISRTRYQEELNGSARMIVGALRDLQTRALTASSVQSCTDISGIKLVCNVSTVGCVSACGTEVVPYAYGLTFTLNATSVSSFADIDPQYNDRRPILFGGADEHERVADLSFLKASSSSNYVTISWMVVDGGLPVGSAQITFERQNGLMRINGCDTPAPHAWTCFPSEPTTLVLTLRHSRTRQTKIIRLNGLTGKISID
jgi:prepilin-type N-terminal cleavage/methylation domain-containing protein